MDVMTPAATQIPAVTQIIEVLVPDIGDFKDVPIIEILARAGATVGVEETLVVLESDKATIDVPSPASGVIKEVHVKLNDRVSEGSALLLLEVSAPTVDNALNPAPRPAKIDEPAVTQMPAVTRIIEVVVPDIGDFKDVPIIEILAAPGARVDLDETLVVLESDKATIDIPSPATGIINAIRVQLNDRVSQGSILVLLEVAAAESEISGTPKATVAPGEIRAPERATAPPQVSNPAAPPLPSGVLPHASPLARRFARELGVPLAEVAGTGPKGRILRNDIQDFVKRAVAAKASAPLAASSQSGLALELLPWPQIDFTKFGPVERVSLSKIKKISGANLSRNSIIIPHVTNFDQADITELEKFRTDINGENKDKNQKLTMLAFMIKASVVALKKHPLFNASLDGEELILKQYFHIGFAADTPNGLVVPVIKDADAKGLHAIAAEASALAMQARDGTLKAGAMQGGCFTISSLGGIGGDGFTPIINAPEVAILGAARAKMTPVWDGAGFVPRLIMPVSLSWDHRVIDGAEAARFLVTFTHLLADFRRVGL